MSVTTPPTIDPVPTPAIQRNDRTTFSDRLDAFILWLISAVTQFAALATNVFNNATDAYVSAGIASAGAAAAVAASGVLPWVSGTMYSAGSPGVGASVVSSLINFKTYRRKTNGAGTTDPSADSTNWQLISWGAYPILHVREQQPAGTASASPTALGNSDVTLNTTLSNSITGASLSSSTIILPVGTYDVDITSGLYNAGRHKISLYNITAGATQLVGTNELTANTGSEYTRSRIHGRFKITSATTFKVVHYMEYAAGAGQPMAASGLAEVYADAVFKQVEQG
jgi:hypothetical protein